LNPTAMTELVKGLIQVRDALTLIAFLSLVLLVAFRTPKVPELFFGLVRDKLTRQEFSHMIAEVAESAIPSCRCELGLW